MPATYLLNRTAPKTHDRFTRSDDIKRPEIIRSILPTKEKLKEKNSEEEKKKSSNETTGVRVVRFPSKPPNPPLNDKLRSYTKSNRDRCNLEPWKNESSPER